MTDENKQALEAVQWIRNNAESKVRNLDLDLAVKLKDIEAALQPKPSVDVEDYWQLEPLAQLIQDWGLNNGYRMVASEAEDLANSLHSQGHLNQGWQDIESAPKDGTEIILLHSDDNGVYVREGSWGLCAVWTGEEIETWRYDLNVFNSCPPTHWMPFPQPPSEGE